MRVKSDSSGLKIREKITKKLLKVGRRKTRHHSAPGVPIDGFNRIGERGKLEFRDHHAFTVTIRVQPQC